MFRDTFLFFVKHVLCTPGLSKNLLFEKITRLTNVHRRRPKATFIGRACSSNDKGSCKM